MAHMYPHTTSQNQASHLQIETSVEHYEIRAEVSDALSYAEAAATDAIVEELRANDTFRCFLALVGFAAD